MPYQYRMTVQPIDGAGGGAAGDALAFEVANHDDLFAILTRMQERQLLSEGEVVPFVIGLKLFTEVLIRHRREPLFEDLGEAMGRFMKRLKGETRQEPAGQ